MQLQMTISKYNLLTKKFRAMKKLMLFSLLGLLCVSCATAQDVKVSFITNDDDSSISSEQIICKNFTDRMTLSVSLSKVLQGEDSYYNLVSHLLSRKPITIPYNGRMLIKLEDGSILELKCQYGHHSDVTTTVENGAIVENFIVYENYRISEADLAKLFDGVKKVRIELDDDVYDKSFRKDVIGEALHRSYNSIENCVLDDFYRDF